MLLVMGSLVVLWLLTVIGGFDVVVDGQPFCHAKPGGRGGKIFGHGLGVFWCRGQEVCRDLETCLGCLHPEVAQVEHRKRIVQL